MKLVGIILVIILEISSIISQDTLNLCTPLTSNLKPEEFPKLPPEFQTRIEINYISQKRNSEAIVIYDSDDKRAEVSVREQDGTFRIVYYFDQNLVFRVRKDGCDGGKLDSSAETTFFGLIITVNGLNMLPPNEVLHFNNGYPHVKLDGTTTYRGINVTHYTSCQDWPELNATYTIDYYFKVPEHNPAVVYDQSYTEIPVAAVVEGYYDVNKVTNTGRYVKHEYNFFEFRTLVDRKADLYQIPGGVYCEGVPLMAEMLPLPKSYAFFEEIVYPDFKYAKGTKIFYSSELKSIRYDYKSAKVLGPAFVDNAVSYIHDYNSGVGYVVNKVIGNCTMYPIGTQFLDASEFIGSVSQFGLFLDLKGPDELFFIDDSYYFAGQRFERGILCNVFVSKRLDFKLPGIVADYYIFELYMRQIQSGVEQSTDELEWNSPVSLHITASGANFTVANYIYDFDSKFDRDFFDISKCFSGKDIIRFGIRFRYPDGVDEQDFKQFYGKLLEQSFVENVMNSTSVFTASPLRILPPEFEAHERGFTVYSGITNFAPAINHFIKNGLKLPKLKSNPNPIKPKVLDTIASSSAENCAYACLTDNKFTTSNERCLGFDFCPNPSGDGFLCKFYNYSIITDNVVVEETLPNCDHYGKTSATFDATDVNILYRTIEDAVVRRNFDLHIKDNQGNKILTFRSTDIEKINGLNQGGGDNFGNGDAFRQFILKDENLDFNDERISQDSMINYRTRNLVSLDQCAGLCAGERSFPCETFSYAKVQKECKWSSLYLDFDSKPGLEFVKEFTVFKKSHDFYYKNALSNYYEYPMKLTASGDDKAVSVSSANDCAKKCNSETEFNCRGFNFCLDENADFICYLSETNVHKANTSLIQNLLCDHYSKRAVSDFEQITQTQLSVSPKTKLFDVSVETCAEMCSFEDSYLCRSFDYFTNSRSCNLYKENLKDSIFIELNVTFNQNATHYSRLYYEENGVLIKVEAVNPNLIDAQTEKTSKTAYGGGTIFGIVFALIIGGILMGLMGALAYIKVTKKPNTLPVMRFTNPNYSASDAESK